MATTSLLPGPPARPGPSHHLALYARRVTRWTTPPARCGEHGCWGGWPEPVATWPNLVTLVRTLLAVLVAAVAVVTATTWLLLVSLAVYWVGDVLDGVLARRLRQETRRGAAFDVVTDRVCAVAFWLPWAWMHRETVPAVSVYLVEFVLVDGVLSLLWLAWPLLSCNYVERVDALVYRLNWWPPAKAANTAGLLVLLLVWPSPRPALVFVLAVLAVKVASLGLLLRRLPAPGPGCARVAALPAASGIVASPAGPAPSP
jgi:CDP-diacylglycerol--glycerol-3-phosphate 3-phosphatidyltransferase